MFVHGQGAEPSSLYKEFQEMGSAQRILVINALAQLVLGILLFTIVLPIAAALGSNGLMLGSIVGGTIAIGVGSIFCMLDLVREMRSWERGKSARDLSPSQGAE